MAFGGFVFGGAPFGGGKQLPFDLTTSDIALVLPEYHAIDMFSKDGGFHTSRQLTSDVTSLFLPGIIVGSDSSETVRYQHRKMFVKNLSPNHKYYVKVYGFNARSSKVIKWSLEKDVNHNPLIDGSEVIKDYLTPPGLYGTYGFTEVQSDSSLLVGNNGALLPGKGQGVWLRQACLKNMSDLASDEFCFGILWSDLGTA